MSVSWNYALLSDTPDEDEVSRRARSGEGWVALIRSVPDLAEQILLPEGRWKDSQRLLAISANGAMEWTYPVVAAEARRTVDHWLHIGKLAQRPELDAHLPPAIDQQARERAGAREQARLLRTSSSLGRRDVAGFRRRVLDGKGDVSRRWLAADGRVVGLGRRPVSLSSPDKIASKHRAFAAVGADRIWAINAAPDSSSKRSGLPTGVSAPVSADGLRAVWELYGTYRSMSLTTPALDCVILQAYGYGVVGGPREFVESVLGAPLDEARRNFLRYAAGEDVPPPLDLTPVVRRYFGKHVSTADVL